MPVNQCRGQLTIGQQPLLAIHIQQYLVKQGRALRFPHEAAARAFAAQLHTRREWLLTQQSQADGPEPSPEQ